MLRNPVLDSEKTEIKKGGEGIMPHAKKSNNLRKRKVPYHTALSCHGYPKQRGYVSTHGDEGANWGKKKDLGRNAINDDATRAGPIKRRRAVFDHR